MAAVAPLRPDPSTLLWEQQGGLYPRGKRSAVVPTCRGCRIVMVSRVHRALLLKNHCSQKRRYLRPCDGRGLKSCPSCGAPETRGMQGHKLGLAPRDFSATALLEHALCRHLAPFRRACQGLRRGFQGPLTKMAPRFSTTALVVLALCRHLVLFQRGCRGLRPGFQGRARKTELQGVHLHPSPGRQLAVMAPLPSMGPCLRRGSHRDLSAANCPPRG